MTAGRWLDIFAAPLFKHDGQGRHVFYPWGAWGAGFVIDDEAATERLRRTVRNTWLAVVLAGAAVAAMLVPDQVAIDLPAIVAAGAGVGLAMSLWFRWLVRRWPRSEIRLSMREAQDARTRAMGRGGLLVMLAMSLLLIGVGCLAIAVGGPDGLWAGSLLIAMFSGCLVVFVWQWRRLQRLES